MINGTGSDFGADDLPDVITVALGLIALGVPYQVDGSAEVRAALRQAATGLSARLVEAADPE